VIHNDGNGHNVLVGSPSRTQREVTGLVDFGDLVEAPLVCEPAVAVAYAVFGDADPAAAACALVAGYDSARRLEDAELDALWTLAAVRLCASVCIAAERHGADAADDPYLYITETGAWDALARMREIHPRLALYRLRGACGRVPCPKGAETTAWLAAHPAEARQSGRRGPLARRRSSTSPSAARSSSLPPTRPTPARMTERLFGRMREAGAPAGIGRLRRGALIYATDAVRGRRRRAPGAAHRAPRDRRLRRARLSRVRAAGGPSPCGPRQRREARLRPDRHPRAHSPGAPVFYTLYGHLAAESLPGLTRGAPVARARASGGGLPSRSTATGRRTSTSR
jgi:hypothetical protein